MQAWQVGLVLTMAVGVGVILAGALIDRTRGRERARALASPPDRAGIDPGLRPAYVGAEAAYAGAADEPLDADLEGRLADSAPLRAALAPDHGDRVALAAPRVLVCADEVGATREVLRVVAAHDPLVIAAPGFAAEAARTLAANRVQGKRRVVAVVADDAARAEICARTGARPLSRRDLMAGWAPDDALGAADAWASDAAETRLAERTRPAGRP